MTNIADLLTVGPPKTEEEYDYPRPERSFILVHLVEGSDYLLRRWNPETRVEDDLGLEFWGVYHEGGSAEIEAEAGMLKDVIAGMMDREFEKVGWFVIDGFYGVFSTDYWGETDCDHEYEVMRPARWSDLKRMEVQVSWWGQMLIMLGLDGDVPPRFGHPK